ncbi:MAG: N-acetylmuramoyl-L-alanine amidase [Deltaproteobacteria bacterium]|nr:MAG: N-acetylmuramoyl-L-alanine amidase [Deltaproteobacteria bacterium]
MSRGSRLTLLAGVLLLVLGAGKRPAGLLDVTDVRVFDHPNHTRVVVELSGSARYHTGTLEDPARLYIDIDGVWIEAPLREPRSSGASAPLRRVRAGQNTLQRARVVMELAEGSVKHHTFHLKQPFRIVTDVYRAGSASEPTPDDDRFDQRPVRRIVLDPGHGGKDPGARGRGGVKEKDVVLRVSRLLRDRLRQAGFEVVMTRERDEYLSLEERTAVANRLKGDLFISIHANASPNRKTTGVETYLLDTRYDRQTARVAARENGTSIGQLNELQRILASLRLGYHERYAVRLAREIHESLLESLRRSYRGTSDLGVKHGPFLVLFMADMPAILVEVGFVSNRAEARRLSSKAFARAAAAGIANGIVRYRDEHARRLVAGR